MATREDLRELLLQAADALELQAPAGPVQMVAPGALVVDPKRFQFRQSVVNLSGTDGRLRDACRWNPALAGVLLVWPEGDQLCLIDGHHRHRLAIANDVALVAVLLVEASDARAARVLGALSNLANGTAEAPDLAKLLRDTGMTAADVARHGVSRRSRVLADAEALVGLDDRLFEQVAAGEINTAMGIALAAAGAPAHQRALAREATRRNWSPEQVAEASKLAQLATVTTTTATGCLPGFEQLLEEANSNLGELLAVRAAIRKALGKEITALATIARKRAAQSLEAQAVAVIDVAAASEARDSSKAAARLFDLLAGHAGPLQTLIRQLAAEVSERRTAGQVVADHLPAIRQAIEAELGG